MKTMLRILGLLTLLALAACGWLWYEARLFLNTAPETPGREMFFDVPQGRAPCAGFRGSGRTGIGHGRAQVQPSGRYKRWEDRLQAGRLP